MIVEQTRLPLLLPHHALAAVERRFRVFVADVQPAAVGGARQPDNQRAHAKVFVLCVQEHDVAIADGAALARVMVALAAKSPSSPVLTSVALRASIFAAAVLTSVALGALIFAAVVLTA